MIITPDVQTSWQGDEPRIILERIKTFSPADAYFLAIVPIGTRIAIWSLTRSNPGQVFDADSFGL